MTRYRFGIYALACLLALSGFVLDAGTAAAQSSEKPHPAASYMQQVAKELISAQNRGTISGYTAVLQRRADMPAIGQFALGRYRPRLAAGDRGIYYRGVRRWISRYMLEQSKRYAVIKADIEPAPKALKGGEFSVKSKVHLKSGARYTVVWRVAPRRGSYRILDAKILGFSMVSQLRSLFVDFLAKRGRTMRDLIVILNQ